MGRALLAAGLLLLLAVVGDFALGVRHARDLDDRWQHQLAVNPPPPHAGAALVEAHPVDGVDFAVHVPKIGYRAAVAEGTDSGTLASGPGHYTDTAWPGQAGLVGVAAHNVYWIAFDRLQPGDEVQLETRWGTYTYRIAERRVVWPSDRSILVHTPRLRLALTTCWPLWAGAFANQRLVFLADQVDPAASPAVA